MRDGNIEDGDIVVIDKVEDDSYDGKEFKKVTDKAGNKFNVKSGRGGALRDKWPLLEEGAAIKLQVGEFNGKPFVKDFTVVKDELASKATEKAQTQVRVEKNDSIEAQVAFKGMVELISTGMVGKDTKEYRATIEWAMSRLHSVEQIVAKIEEAVGGTSTKGGQGAQTTDKQAERVSGFFKYLENHGVEDVATFLTKYGVDPEEILTEKRCEELYKTIKKDKEW